MTMSESELKPGDVGVYSGDEGEYTIVWSLPASEAILSCLGDWSPGDVGVYSGDEGEYSIVWSLPASEAILSQKKKLSGQG